MAIKSVFKPEGSVLAGVAVIGVVYANYNLNVGSVAQAHVTPANNGSLESSRKKAGYSSLVLVGGIGLIAKDLNIIILGSLAIVAMELSYRHAIMAHPETGQIVPPSPSRYQPAENVVPITQQGQSVSVG